MGFPAPQVTRRGWGIYLELLHDTKEVASPLKTPSGWAVHPWAVNPILLMLVWDFRGFFCSEPERYVVQRMG